MSERPLGVTILGILWIIGGLFAIIGGLFLIIRYGAILWVLGDLHAFIGPILFILGVIYLLLGIGCFKAWPWVWIIGGFSAISILISIVNLLMTGLSALLGIVIAVIILYYLFQPQVKAYFGKV